MTLDELDWAEVAQRLTLFVFRRMGRGANLADAEEVAQEAIKRFFDPKYAAWNKGKEPDIMRFLGSVANGVLSNRLKKSIRRRELLESNGTSLDDDKAPNLEASIADKEIAHRGLKMLRQRLPTDGLEMQVLELCLDGVSKPRAQAQALGVAVEDIYVARRTLASKQRDVRRLVDEESA